MRPACTASLEAKTKGRRKALCGGAIRRRYHLLETAPTFRARREQPKAVSCWFHKRGAFGGPCDWGHLIARVRRSKFRSAADEAFLLGETTRLCGAARSNAIQLLTMVETDDGE
jgi:hypothetical protein